MRWLFKRLPGFTSLICDTKCPFLYHWLRNDVLVEDRTEAMEAITWFVTQLPMIAKASASKMDLRITSDVSPMLLNLSTIDDNTYLFGRGHRVHDGFWDALSESLVELSIEMHAPYVFRQDDIAKRWTSVFNKLTNLTSLKVSEGKGKATSKSKGKGKGKGKVSVTMKNGETFEL
ncbi:g1943 [Coccomyxa viridis]|uniref:G1943 protein n=1 Tax=Coccomyxa viridis TaxID=1274662 RepID=A0ABP1FKT6_9CHLO